jgi:hypothetical protein
MGDDPMALLGLEGALKHYYYYEELQQLVDGARAHGVRVGALVDSIPTVRKSAYAHGGPYSRSILMLSCR